MNDFEVHPIGTAQRLAELERDAARYRWIRRKACVIQSWHLGGEISFAEFEFINMPRLNEVPAKADAALDAAIDAAMGEAK